MLATTRKGKTKKESKMMKKRIAALVTAGVLALSMLTGCGSKQESWKVTCPWAPSGVAAMVSQKAAAKSPDYSDNKITLVAEAVKGDAATVNTWVSSTKAMIRNWSSPVRVCSPLPRLWIRPSCSSATTISSSWRTCTPPSSSCPLILH